MCRPIQTANSDSQLDILGRRLHWMFHAIAGPEFALGFATGQYEHAHKAVRDFKELGYSQWTMRHALFADTGGFMLHPRGSKPIPVYSKHIQWLTINVYSAFPQVGSLDIWDKSKPDRLIKSLVCIQICWLIINVVARAIQGLAITTLELATISIAFCTIATFFC